MAANVWLSSGSTYGNPFGALTPPGKPTIVYGSNS